MSFALKTISEKDDAAEIFDVLGPRIQFLTALSNNDEDYCLISGVVPTGVVVPVHSHAERETFYVLQGEIQALWEDRWISLSACDVFDVPSGVKHAWRNVSDASVSVLVTAPMRLGRLLRDLGRPAASTAPGAPSTADLQRFAEVARTYGCWLGGPADNEAVGISFG